VFRRVLRCIARHGVGRDDDDGGDALDQLAAESLQPGVPGVPDVQRPQGRFEAFQDGFFLHCGMRLHEKYRAGIERLCRYGARGPLTSASSARTPTAGIGTA
jgi:hypothetical protein